MDWLYEGVLTLIVIMGAVLLPALLFGYLLHRREASMTPEQREADEEMKAKMQIW